MAMALPTMMAVMIFMEMTNKMVAAAGVADVAAVAGANCVERSWQ